MQKKLKKNVFGRLFLQFSFFSKMANITHGPNDEGTHRPKKLEFRQFFMTNWSKKGKNSATEKLGPKKNPRKQLWDK